MADTRWSDFARALELLQGKYKYECVETRYHGDVLDEILLEDNKSQNWLVISKVLPKLPQKPAACKHVSYIDTPVDWVLSDTESNYTDYSD